MRSAVRILSPTPVPDLAPVATPVPGLDQMVEAFCLRRGQLRPDPTLQSLRLGPDLWSDRLPELPDPFPAGIEMCLHPGPLFGTEIQFLLGSSEELQPLDHGTRSL